MKNFEENLEKLEQLTSDIKRTDISLEDALKDFEQGIALAHGMEKDIDAIEGKIQILMNNPVPDTDKTAPRNASNTPELSLFDGADESTGSAGAPSEGVRQ